jgi:hypothetical protein
MPAQDFQRNCHVNDVPAQRLGEQFVGTSQPLQQRMGWEYDRATARRTIRIVAT